MIRYFLFLMLCLSSCTDSHESEIISLLESRDASISQQNIMAYSLLLADTYLEKDGINVVMKMEDIFQRFSKVNMISRDREIRILSDQQAICEQTYILKVFADHEWREIVQREQLTFTYINGRWRISGGL